MNKFGIGKRPAFRFAVALESAVIALVVAGSILMGLSRSAAVHPAQSPSGHASNALQQAA